MPARLRLVSFYIHRARTRGLLRTMRDLTDPRKVARHANRVLAGNSGQVHSNTYRPSHSRSAEVSFAAVLAGARQHDVVSLFDELARDDFVAELRVRYLRTRIQSPFHVGRFRILYALVRLLSPGVVLETGVHDGLSAAIILRAMDRNQHGRLVSVDLPSMDLPTTEPTPGWLVPLSLREHWSLHLGDARILLPRLVRELAPIDLFFHDSDHSQSHQEFEFRTVRPFLAATALIISDQDYPFDPLIEALAEEWGAAHWRVRTVSGEPGGYMGGLRIG
jgi:predicted O-methyltransferase YrrM